MLLPLTSIYAALLGLLLVVLSMNVSRVRGVAKVSLGDGGHQGLIHAIRAQGNFIEYVPMAVILIALAEGQNAPAVAIHVLGVALVVGRVLQALGLVRAKAPMAFRFVGSLTTYLVILLTALGLLVHRLF